ncbi:hypothetical protein D918_08001 [Trichuris suis]|nr:hypothetical protein D918_08001 [Trichuris suis]
MEMYTMLALHNIKRSEASAEIFGTPKYQANMECLNNVSMELTTYAQSLANDCNATDYSKSPYGITIFRKSGYRRIGPYEYMDKAEEYMYDYNIITNECKGSNTELCRLFRQVYWYQGSEIGCGRAICGSDARIVCVYTHKANEEYIPFIIHPKNKRCQYCSSMKRVCSSQELCCEADL